MQQELRTLPAFVHVILTALINFGLAGVPAQFTRVFAGFGAELPWLTQILITTPAVFYVLPITSLLALLAYSQNIQRASQALVTCLILSVLLVPLTLAAMYLPIFRLGS